MTLRVIKSASFFRFQLKNDVGQNDTQNDILEHFV
jgi:hypothetical protein